MIGIENNDGSLYEINIDTDNESVEKSSGNEISKTQQNGIVDEYAVPWLRNVPRFQKFDFVVDALRQFPSSETVYGVIKSINSKGISLIQSQKSIN